MISILDRLESCKVKTIKIDRKIMFQLPRSGTQSIMLKSRRRKISGIQTFQKKNLKKIFFCFFRFFFCFEIFKPANIFSLSPKLWNADFILKTQENRNIKKKTVSLRNVSNQRLITLFNKTKFTANQWNFYHYIVLEKH